jgi:hypothetical protein
MIDAADVKPGYYWARFGRARDVTIVLVVGPWPEGWNWMREAKDQALAVWTFEWEMPHRLDDFVFVAPVAPLEDQ